MAVLEEGDAGVGGWARDIIDNCSLCLCCLNLSLAPSIVSDAEDEVEPVGDGGEDEVEPVGDGGDDKVEPVGDGGESLDDGPGSKVKMSTISSTC